MQSLLFDDTGGVWDAKSPRLAEALQASLSGDELAKYVVKNLGFIAAAQSAGSVRLRLRPAVVSPTAMSALFYWLYDQAVERVLISYLDEAWSHELVRSCEEAVQQLTARAPLDLDDRMGDFLQQQRPLSGLPATSPFRAMLAAWSECNGKFDGERFGPLLEKALNRQFVLVEARKQTPNLYFKAIGSGLPKLSEYCLPPNVKLRVDDQPDYAYGKWVAGLYRGIATSGQPTLQEIDAVIRWPENPRKSYRYRRLVLPFEGEGNSTMLLGATQLDPLINLRVKSG